MKLRKLLEKLIIDKNVDLLNNISTNSKSKQIDELQNPDNSIHNINSELEISGIECDSRKIKSGDLFVAYPGEESDGRKYIDQAIQNGATAILTEKTKTNINHKIPIFPIDNLKTKAGKIAAEFYNHPSKSIQIIGVTGTNGKTSTCFYSADILNGMGIKTAVIGTTGYGIPGNLTELNNTTPGPVELQKIFAKLKDDNVKVVAMEVSSHALSQGRVSDIEIDAAVYTNLSQDHLDYHKNMKDYANAKKMIFHMPTAKYISLNIDDKYGCMWFKEFSKNAKKQLIGFSTAMNRVSNTIQAESIKLNMAGLSFNIQGLKNKSHVETKLLGHFNVSNILAAVSILILMKYDKNEIIKQCKYLKAVPGRMQVCRSEKLNLPIAVIDYAHTPDALENALSALKKQCHGKLSCVFGCGGNRDRKKRPLMAQAVEKYSDNIVVTNDNPRYEDQYIIIDDIKKGFSSLKNIMVEADRKIAIELALKNGCSNDIVLIAGKGHEDYQIVDGIKHHFSDVEIVEGLFSAKS
jgi:UDP-N-acetylmuramoyl-L-alanyl-D-glutamate--2,6-diaminopimelate ligase